MADAATTPEKRRSDDHLPEWLTQLLQTANEHLPLLAGAAVFFVVVFEILAVANFDRSVALGLIAFADPPRILIGVILGFVAPAAVVLVAAACMSVGVAFALNTLRGGAVFGLLVALSITAIVAPIAVMLVGVLFGIGVGAVSWIGVRLALRDSPEDARRAIERWEDPSLDGARRNVIVAQAVLMVLIGFSILTVGDPWMPPEALIVSGQRVTGYVVSSDDRWFTYLTARDRTLVTVPAQAVTERGVCEFSTAPWSKPLATFVEQPDVPMQLCPDVQAAPQTSSGGLLGDQRTEGAGR